MVESSSSGGRYQIDAQKLWIGGLMAGIVAAGVAIVGLLIVMGVFDIKVFVPGNSDEVVNASTWWYAIVSFFAALLTTGLLPPADLGAESVAFLRLDRRARGRHRRHHPLHQ